MPKILHLLNMPAVDIFKTSKTKMNDRKINDASLICKVKDVGEKNSSWSASVPTSGLAGAKEASISFETQYSPLYMKYSRLKMQYSRLNIQLSRLKHSV